MLIFFVIANLYTLLGTISPAPQELDVSLPFPPAIRMALALFWIVVFTFLLIHLMRRDRLSLRWIAPFLTAYALSNLIWALLFVRSDYGRGAFGFQGLASTVLLIPVWWITIRRR